MVDSRDNSIDDEVLLPLNEVMDHDDTWTGAVAWSQTSSLLHNRRLGNPILLNDVADCLNVSMVH